MQSVIKHKHRSLIQQKEKNKKLIKVYFSRLQNQVKVIDSNMRRNGSRYNFLINKVFKKYFNPGLNSFRQSLFFKRLILHLDLKKSPNKNLKILKKVMLNANKIRNSSQSKFLDLYVFVPIKLIFKQFRLLGLLSYKKNKFCVNNSITFKNYEDIIKFYSTIIIRLLLYFQLADN